MPTNPPIIALDTRTQRQVDPGDHDYHPPRLLDRYALDWLRVEWAKLKADLSLTSEVCPVLITSVPIMEFNNITFVKQAVLAVTGVVESWKPLKWLEKISNQEGKMTGLAVSKLDVEATNKDGYAAFLTTLVDKMGIQRCVFLSGDVHHSFSAIAWFKTAGKRLDCYQLTSSALKNKPHDIDKKLIDLGEKQTSPVMFNSFPIFPTWRSKIQLLAEKNTGIRISIQCNLALIEFRDGLPEKHTLLTGEEIPPVYLLPKSLSD